MPKTRFLRTGVLAALIALAGNAPSSVIVAQSGPPPLIPFRGLIDHVSVNMNGWPSTSSADAGPHAISADGRYVVMDSYAADLVPNDFNYDSDVFLRDRTTGTTTRVSVADNGAEAAGGSLMSSISAGGRHVVFSSYASNLVAGDTNGHYDIFVRDLDANRTVRVSIATDGSQTDADSMRPVVSASGRFVAFLSTATTLAPGIQPYQGAQTYLHDRDTDGNGIFDEPGGTSTSLVSVSSSGQVADTWTDGVRISSDGRFVLFESLATNLDPVVSSPNYANHLYLRDTQTGETALIDRAVTGGPSGWGVDYRTADMSDDGRFITFTSISPDIVWFDMNWVSQAFLYDTSQGPISTAIVSRLPDGTIANASSYSTSVSKDGRYVAFVSSATNLASPAPAPNTAGVIVRDMIDGTFTRVDVVDGGSAFDHQYPYQPALSADGTAVAFSSNAQNAIDGMYAWNADHVFVATAFVVSPTAASFPATGGDAVLEIDTTPVSGWRATTYDSWIYVSNGSEFAAGPRTVHYYVTANETGITRDGSIRVGSTIVRVHQDGDGDTTPPAVTPTITGTLTGAGWYVGSVTVQWTVTDPDSPIVSQSYGCGGVTFTGDAIYAPVTCEATSHGGTTSETVVIRIDNTAPAIAITTPAASVYAAGAIVAPSFACTDATGYSGVDSCAVTEGSTPLDMTPGRHVFAVTATDRAGNSTTKSVEYLVGTGVCVPPNEGLKAWWRFEGDTADALGNLIAAPAPPGTLQFASGVAGQSWQSQSTTYLQADDGERLLAWNGLTVAAWMRPTGQIGEAGTIVSKPAQYRIARYPDGTLRWAFSQTTGFEWVNTGVVIPTNVWTHVAVSYDNGLVNTYVNGRLAHSQQLSGSLTYVVDWSVPMTIGGRPEVGASYFGWLDELQIFTPALPAAEIESIALAGGGGLCVPAGTSVVVSVPQGVGYGATFPATATLRDGAGNPIPDRQIVFTSYVSPAGTYAGGAFGTTDASGQAQADVPMSLNVTAGSYAHGVTATFMGDVHYQPSQGASDVTVVTRTPEITWPAPPAMVYGQLLGGNQLNASATTAGTFTYTPAAGTILGAGTRTLSVTFTPADPQRWGEATATTTVVVNTATPSITWPMPAGITYGTALNVAQLNASANVPGTFAYAPAAGVVLPVGTHPLSVTFTPTDTANYSGASASKTLAVARAPLRIAVQNVSKPYGATLPPFSVSTSDFVNGDSLASLAGALTFSTSATTTSPVGNYAVTPSGLTSSNYTIAFVNGTLSIVKASTATAIAASPNPAGFNQAVTLVATVSVVAPGAGAPGSVVQFFDGNTLLGSAPLTGATASLTTNGFSAGAHTMSATYGGDASFAPSSGASTLAVKNSAASSTTSVSSSSNPANAGENVTFTATIAAPGGLGGNVGFYDGDLPLGTAAVSGTTARLTTSALAIGGHAITARYLGNGTIPPSTSQAFAQHVQPSGTKTRTSAVALVATPSPATLGSNVALKATVNGTNRLPSGTVTFMLNGSVLAQGALSASGSVTSTTTINTATLPHGTHVVEAVYLGDAALRASTTKITVVVN